MKKYYIDTRRAAWEVIARNSQCESIIKCEKTSDIDFLFIHYTDTLGYENATQELKDKVYSLFPEHIPDDFKKGRTAIFFSGATRFEPDNKTDAYNEYCNFFEEILFFETPVPHEVDFKTLCSYVVTNFSNKAQDKNEDIARNIRSTVMLLQIYIAINHEIIRKDLGITEFETNDLFWSPINKLKEDQDAICSYIAKKESCDSNKDALSLLAAKCLVEYFDSKGAPFYVNESFLKFRTCWLAQDCVANRINQMQAALDNDRNHV